MTPRDLALTGVPRSGTTLCCRLVGLAEDCVSLFEPMEVAALPRDRAGALGEGAAFYRDTRASLRADGTAWSQQVAGQVPDNPFASQRDAAGQRRREAERGRIRVDKPLGPSFVLAIKHNAAFTALLPELAGYFDTVAIVRNPLAVLSSWHSVDLPVSRGRLPAGERLDPLLAARLDAEQDLIARQLLLLDWLFDRYQRFLPRGRVLAYEEVVASGGTLLADAFGLRLQVQDLHERNASHLYSARTSELLAQRLQADAGAWRSRYDDADVERLLARMQAGAVA